MSEETFVLASASVARQRLLRRAGVTFSVRRVNVDEEMMRRTLSAQGRTGCEAAVHIAQAKAALAGQSLADDLIIGCDQVLEFDGRMLGRCARLEEARDRLKALRGRTHALHTAVIAWRDGGVIWRHVETASITMRAFSDVFLEWYLETFPDAVHESTGCYRIEAEGSQLIADIRGDFFAIIGLPLWPLMDFLRRAGMMAE